ncbi:hypothetical protein GCM10022223_70510 [Kineosporia mesophila]|uniref:Dihydrolipoamide acetyltransferase component of pyruvate dehydrogenase complex n=1 Tax=Kineosporia mesophila TaxID=566012 RepID=A0ABP7AUT1_9ACTN|nr:dihydrolipoamide acetyltransferase family protein [Kineosporia mesophila]MCD5354115.1 2-oxo acid dehydrogenase subunit E2 [Kineosporia mesophila]
MADFLLPDLGEGLTEAEIVTWLVDVGDEVSVDQPVVEVETAKASVEVPVPFAGVVTVLHAEPGDVLAVGTPLITVAETRHWEPSFGGLREPGVEVAPPETDAAGGDENTGSGNVLVGYGTSAEGTPTPRRRRPLRRPGTQTTAPEAAAVTGAGTPSPAPRALPPGTETHALRVISPLVRRLARDAGIDLRQVSGSGPGGLILRADVEQTARTQTNQLPGPGDVPHPAPTTAKAASPGPASPGPASPAPLSPGTGSSESLRTAASPRPSSSPASAPSPDRGFERIALTGIRRMAAEKLSRSRREIPEATIWVDADATGLLEARAVLNGSSHGSAQGPSVSIVALLTRFTVAGLRRYPELNATVEGGEIHRHRAVHLGFAAQTDRGLVVPVVKDADLLSTRQLAGAIGAMAERAREGVLTPGDLSGGTFTVNNYGVFGTDGAAAIINHPEAAILGIGRIVERPWAVAGQVVARQVTQLTLSFDHRVCDGAVAGGFLRFVADCVERPVTALGDL